MRTDQLVRPVSKSGESLDVANYRIDDENIAHVTAILRSMYSRPELAILREYTANGIDAHVAAGVAEPIEVHLPTYLEPYFSTRDFGGGLDIENTKKLLLGYGSSGEHKRAAATAATQIGGFGIGAKCGFAVADAFSYTIYHGGKKRVWSCFLNEHDLGQAELKSEEDSSERPGVEINVPMKAAYHDVNKFTSLLTEIFTFMPASKHPKVLNPPPGFAFPEPPKVLLSTKISGKVGADEVSVNLEIIDKSLIPDQLAHLKETPTLILGGTAYSVDLDNLGFVYPQGVNDDRGEHDTRQALLQNSVIQAPIGFVQVAPSREALKYSGATKKILNAVYAALLSDAVLKDLQKQVVSDSATYAERILKHQLSKIPSPKNKWFNGSGYKLPVSCGKFFGHVKVAKDSYYKSYRVVSLSASDPMGTTDKYHPIYTDADQDVMVIAVGKHGTTDDSLRAYAERAFTKFKTDNPTTTKALSITFFDVTDATAIPWLVDGSVTYVPEIDDLPKADTVLFTRPSYRSSRRTGPGSRGGTGGNTYVQNARKFVKLGTEYKDPLSQCWDACLAKDIKDGIYVKLRKYKISAPGRDERFGLESRQEYGEMQKMFHPGDRRTELAIETLLPKATVLLGVKEANVASIESKTEFTCLWKYIYDRFSEDFAAGLIDSEGFVYGLYRECYTKSALGDDAAKATSKWFEFVKNCQKRDNILSTELGSRLKWWHESAAKCNGRTEQWVNFLLALAHVLIGSGNDGKTVLNRMLTARDEKTKNPLVDWSLLVGEDAKFLQSIADDKSKTTLEIVEETVKVRTSRFAKDIAYALKNHALLAFAFGLTNLYDSHHGDESKLGKHCETLEPITIAEALLKQESLYAYVELVESEVKKAA